MKPLFKSTKDGEVINEPFVELWRFPANSKEGVFVTDFDFVKQAKEHLLKVRDGFESEEKGSTRLIDDMTLELNSVYYGNETYKLVIYKKETYTPKKTKL